MVIQFFSLQNMKFLNYIFYSLIYFSSIFAQTWHPLHYQQLENHIHHNPNFEMIDSLARNDVTVNNRNSGLSHEVIGYLPYWEYEKYTDIDYELITQINYFSIELDQYGNIENDHNWPNLYLVEYAQARGVKVKLCATLFGYDNLTTLLSSQQNRQNAWINLANLVVMQNADGIDINFELLPQDQKENLVIFMEGLSATLNMVIDNPILTMATPAIDWNDAWDYNQLASIVDGLFIMGYNYFYSGSTSAGPVSPLGGYLYDIDFTINDYLSKTNNQNDKLILGLPYYGYNWPVLNEQINSFTIDLGQPVTYEQSLDLSNVYGQNFDYESNAQWLSYQNSSSWMQCWYDDSLSLSHKYQFALDNELAGIGIWALGYDNNDPKMWGAISDKFRNPFFGDINFDGIVNIIDIVILMNMILEIEEINSNADINNDGFINVLDIMEIVFLITN